MSDASPIHPLLKEINVAAQNGLPFLAIAMTVTLPDVCVSLADPSDSERHRGRRYKRWCRENLGREFGYVTPEDLWSMRCGVLHSGRFGDMDHQVERVIFMLPGAATFQNVRFNDVYYYSLVDFCRNFTAAVENWFESNKDDETVKANLPRLMQYRFGGFPPYVSGTTVVA